MRRRESYFIIELTFDQPQKWDSASTIINYQDDDVIMDSSTRNFLSMTFYPLHLSHVSHSLAQG